MKKILAVILATIITWGLSGCMLTKVSVENHTNVKEATVDVDYETPFLEYMEKNVEKFPTGMIVVDLNEDRIPELLSIDYGEVGALITAHELKNGVVESTVNMTMDFQCLLDQYTYHLDTGNFFGVYRNKNTGKLALISSISAPEVDDYFHIFEYVDGELTTTDHSVKEMVNNSWPIAETRDSIMKDYEYVENGFDSSYFIRGEYVREYVESAVRDLNELLRDFRNGKSKTVLTEFAVENGEILCYVRSIMGDENKIQLVPAFEMEYDKYITCIEYDELYPINGDEGKLQFDENGEPFLYQMPYSTYYFDIPTEEKPTSILEGYFGNEPVTVEFDKNTKIRYGVLGYDDNGEPIGYESLGRENVYSVDEYFEHFAEYSMNSYYKATVKDGKLVWLDVLYHE